MTGIDISPDMVEIARERIAALGEIGEGIEAQAEFHALPVRELPWSSRFDAAILYDTMHHFDNEVETLEVIRRALVPGGQLFIHEGVLPPKGSPGEQNLIEEMKRYGTLESPFEPEYLEEVVKRAGFVEVRRFAEVDELVDLSVRRAVGSADWAPFDAGGCSPSTTSSTRATRRRKGTARRTPLALKPAARGERTASTSCSTSR